MRRLCCYCFKGLFKIKYFRSSCWYFLFKPRIHLTYQSDTWTSFNMNSFWSPRPEVIEHPLSCITPSVTFMSINILISALLLFLNLSYLPYQVVSNLGQNSCFYSLLKISFYSVKNEIPKVLMYFPTCKYPFFLFILQNMEQSYTCTKI